MTQKHTQTRRHTETHGDGDSRESQTRRHTDTETQTREDEHTQTEWQRYRARDTQDTLTPRQTVRCVVVVSNFCFISQFLCKKDRWPSGGRRTKVVSVYHFKCVTNSV